MAYIPVTLTSKRHVAMLPLRSSALHTTSVCPMVKLDPDVGKHDTLTTSLELSVALGASHTTTAVGCPTSASTVILIGQVSITGCSLSVERLR